MLSVVVVTDEKEQPAVATLSSLVAGAASGLIRDVVLVDRSGSDAIVRVADVAGCAYLAVKGSRGEALIAGARQARGLWLLFLPAGAVLDPTWIDETAQFMQSVRRNGKSRVGIFGYARSPYAEPGWQDAFGFLARLFGLPLAEQGLLIAREHYERLGGYSADARRPEATFLRRLGRSARMQLRSRVVVP